MTKNAVWVDVRVPEAHREDNPVDERHRGRAPHAERGNYSNTLVAADRDNVWVVDRDGRTDCGSTRRTAARRRRAGSTTAGWKTPG